MDPNRSRRLDSWKEIAAYLQRDVATVRRWEKREGLPVHRHQHDKLGSVYADADEVDAWYRSRRRDPGIADAPEPVSVSRVAPVPYGPSRPRRWATLPVAAAIAGTAALSVAIWFATRTGTPADREVRFPLTSAEGVAVSSLAVSPDGNTIAIAGAVAGQRDSLWLRALDSTTLVPLARTEGASLPFWSPDNRHIGFFAYGELRRIDVATGAVSLLSRVHGSRGGAWNRDDVILFAESVGPLKRIAAHGGPVTEVTAVDVSGELHRWPEFMPDGQGFVFLVESSEPTRAGVYFATLDAPRPRKILDLKSNAIPTADGRLLFVRDNRLVSQKFDVRSLELTGEETTLAGQVVQQHYLDSKGDFSVSPTGVLVFRAGTTSRKSLVWMNRHGAVVGTLGEPGNYWAPVLSPDQRHVAVVRWEPENPGTDAVIWTIETSTGVATRLTVDKRPNVSPVWSPDGAQIMYAALGPQNDLIKTAVHGLTTDDVVYKAEGNPLLDAWSPDGRYIFYSVFDSRSGYDTWALPLFGGRKPFPVLRNDHWEAQSQLSPNGRLMSYTSNETSRPEVYLTTFPTRTGTWQISSGGGGDARWRSDGRELFYIAANGKLMSVAIGPPPTFTRGIPQPLFDTRIRLLWDMRNHYDVSADGERFLFTVPIDDARLEPFTVVAVRR